MQDPATCTYTPDTYKFATVSGDRTFLHWIYMRLHLVHGEHCSYDYMWCLKDFENGINDVVNDAKKWNNLPWIIKWWFS